MMKLTLFLGRLARWIGRWRPRDACWMEKGEFRVCVCLYVLYVFVLTVCDVCSDVYVIILTSISRLFVSFGWAVGLRRDFVR